MDSFAADLKTVIDALSGLENGAIYIGVGFFAYLIARIAAPSFVVLVVAKYLKEWGIAKKSVTQTNVVKLDGEIISHDDTGDYIRHSVVAMKNHLARESKYKSSYLHNDGAKEIYKAVQKHIEDLERSNPTS